MPKIRAFTWLETLVSIMVFMILASLSSITYHDLLLGQALRDAQVQLNSAILYARSQAVLLSGDVTFCGSTNAWSCDEGWSQGQIVFHRTKLLRVFPPLSSLLKLVWVSSFKKNSAIEFSGDGTTKGQQGRFEIYDRKGRLLAKLIVTHSARLRLEHEE